MVSVIFFVKNDIGGFTPKHNEEFNTYDEALDFYRENKAKYRNQGVYLKMNAKRYIDGER